MRAPSLYSHFASKNAIYDAMFGAGLDRVPGRVDGRRGTPACPHAPRRHSSATPGPSSTSRSADLARHQLMNQRTIPGFVPTEESYAPAVAVLELLRDRVAAIGITRDQDVDLFIAMVGGLVDAQLANDPGGDRWARLLDRASTCTPTTCGL